MSGADHQRVIDAAATAVERHADILGTEGDHETKVRQLLVSLYEYGGVYAVDLPRVFAEVAQQIESGELESPEWSRWYGKPEAPQNNDTKWHDVSIQFPRLLAEINATQELDLVVLAESMDLSIDQVNELFDRADNAWESAKGNITPPSTGGATEPAASAFGDQFDIILGAYGITLGLSNDDCDAGTWEWYERSTNEHAGGFGTRLEAYNSAGEHLRTNRGIDVPALNEDGELEQVE